jgi:hypothetical protein
MFVYILIFTMLGMPSGHQISCQEAILVECEGLFGPRVETPILFEINRFYVLRIDIGLDGQVDTAAIEPKYYYAEMNPDWEEPDDFEWLSMDLFKDLLSRLDQVQPFGELVQQHSGGVIVTNLTAPITDEYVNATVTRGEVADCRRSEDAPILYKYIEVQYR